MSNGVPRRNLKRASSLNALIIHGPKLILRGSPVAGLVLREQRRREMEFEAQVVAAELVRHLLQERAVGVEPRDLVLVLVGHQLEQIARDGLGEPALARRLARLSAAFTFSTSAR